jgi:hypothetical protein
MIALQARAAKAASVNVGSEKQKADIVARQQI